MNEIKKYIGIKALLKSNVSQNNTFEAQTSLETTLL